ncbi:MAG: 6-carboxytetrahydropterin synthase QueD [Patescibacteria group bacterium]|nr:6-carboxytetrahydropterin synthase QueD [Patescibacteria group bacterium]
MYKVTKKINFSYGHRLLNYTGKCKYLHGHNGELEIDIASDTLDERGMVMDFSDVKKIVKEWIDNNIDHKMLLRYDDPLLEYLKEKGEPIFIMETNPTAENIAKLIFDFMVSQGLPVHEVRLWETETSFATYKR